MSKIVFRCLCFFLCMIAKLNGKISNDYLIFDYPREGMFSVFTKVVSALYLYDQNEYAGITINLGESGYYYEINKGPNWWEYYWEPIRLGTLNGFTTIKRFSEDQAKINKARKKLLKLTRQDIHKLIKKYINIKSFIQEEVEQIAKHLIEDHYIIGVHYRGTDRIANKLGVPYSIVEETVNKEIQQPSTPKDFKIFVATDEQSFLEYMQEKFPGKVVCQDMYRSIDGYPLHRRQNRTINGFQIGKEALLDVLLLSRCSLLIRTKSTLSGVASWYNPDMNVIILK